MSAQHAAAISIAVCNHAARLGFSQSITLLAAPRTDDAIDLKRLLPA
jgi:hypothetical protein